MPLHSCLFQSQEYQEAHISTRSRRSGMISSQSLTHSTNGSNYYSNTEYDQFSLHDNWSFDRAVCGTKTACYLPLLLMLSSSSFGD